MFTELTIQAPEESYEILIAELAELGYESFIEQENALQAYIPTHSFQESVLKSLIEGYQDQFKIRYQVQNLQKTNWNEEWEKNYTPVEIADKVRIRAIFHEPKPEFMYEMLITPKMSFGTGHHETTSLMIENQISINHQGKSVLDAGCGTGILAIMAHFLGASAITAFDIDEWAVENAQENCTLNNCKGIKIFQGTMEQIIPQEQFDIILANINRNVLLNDLPLYARSLQKNGYLLLSGFYEADVKDIFEAARAQGMSLIAQKVKNNWTALVCQKK
ncbi:MAG: 50S ribosomal protein L11 methyltransferase [Raineya sp.]